MQQILRHAKTIGGIEVAAMIVTLYLMSLLNPTDTVLRK